MKIKTMTDVAVDALFIINRPTHYKKLTQYIIDSNLYLSRGKTPEATLASNIGAEIRTMKDNSRFIKLYPGIYGLNQKLYPNFNSTTYNFIVADNEQVLTFEKPKKSFLAKLFNFIFN